MNIKNFQQKLSKPVLYIFSCLSLFMGMGAGPLTAQPGCQVVAGVTNVAVDVIRDGQGDPVVESSDKTRSEYAQITSGLADALGINVPADADEDVRPQIRVIVETETLNSGLRSTAAFTVQEVINDNALRVEVYDVDPDEDDPDEDSGTFKLFDSGTFNGNATLTVQAVMPSATTVDLNGVTTVTQHFCEPVENQVNQDLTYGFFEHATIRTARDLLLLVPHGGGIEEGTSEQIAEIEAAVSSRGYDMNIWEGVALWDSDLAAERFHITSKAHDPQSLPGLQQLIDAGDFSPGIEFQYAASLHGFGKFDGNGIVLGGRASLESKCYLAREIQEQLTTGGEDRIAFFIYPPDGDEDHALNLPDGNNKKITDDRPDVGLTGRSCDNVVNRLSQPSGCGSGVGGFQIEESMDLREDLAVRGLVSAGIGHAFADLIADPSLIDPQATTYCDALVAESAPPGSVGEIGDYVWSDDGDGVQEIDELGIGGVTVRLFQDGGMPIATTVTDSNGNYLFTGLAGGDYYLRFEPPAGFTPVEKPVNEPTLGSDIDEDGETEVFSITSNSVEMDIDAGFKAECFAAGLVPFGSVWTHFEPGDTFSNDWFERDFDDVDWRAVQGRAGFPQSAVNESLVDHDVVTYYFRHTFHVTEPALIGDLGLTLYRNDGAVVYLNGVEVLRSNMPQGAIDGMTPALGASETSQTVNLSSFSLLPGPNVLAVEVHNTSAADNDLAFDLELLGEMCQPCRVQSVSLPLDEGTYIEKNDASDNNNSSYTLRVDSGSNDANNTLMRWQLDTNLLPAGAEVLHAEVRVKVDTLKLGTPAVQPHFPMYPLTVDWQEEEATWEQPTDLTDWQVDGALGALDHDASSPLGVWTLMESDWQTLMLNANGRQFLRQWADGLTPNHGLMITHRGQPDREIRFRSDRSVNRPILDVWYSTADVCVP